MFNIIFLQIWVKNNTFYGSPFVRGNVKSCVVFITELLGIMIVYGQNTKQAIG